MKKLFLILSLLLFGSVYANSTTCDYYVSTFGTSSGSGTINSTWDLQTGLQTSLMTTGKTLCVTEGLYKGKYKSYLNGGTVKGINAVIDGYVWTTLNSNMAAGGTTVVFTVANAAEIKKFIDNGVCQGVMIDGEAFFINSIVGNTISANRAAGGSIPQGDTPAHTSGSVVRLAGEQLWVQGNNTTYRNLELMTSSPFRNWLQHGGEGTRGTGIFNVGSGNKFINNIMHDNLNGLFTGNNAHDTEVYGNIIYNNGMINGTEGNGHGMYLENGSGTQSINNNIVLNNYNLGTQLFGVTASYVGGNIQYNTYANNGSPLGGVAGAAQRNLNLLVGTQSQVIADVYIANNYFFHPFNTRGSNMQVGYGAGVADASVLNNTFIGGYGTGLGVINTTHINVTGNKFYGIDGASDPERYAQVENNLRGHANWNNNTYYNAGARSIFTNSTDGLTFTEWKSYFNLSPAFDTTSTAPSGAMPNQVTIIPNTYETGRANVVAYTFSGTSITINLTTTGLVNGQGYTIKNAFNYGGSNVATGTYNSASPNVTVSLSAASVTSVTQPVNSSYTIPTTSPVFSIFVVLPKPLISGTITNVLSTTGVSGVLVDASGISTTSNSSGQYVLTGFGSGSYTVSPSKSRDKTGAISSFDAARIAQNVEGVYSFSDLQKYIADVNGNGVVDSEDATFVSNYAVGVQPYGNAGIWVFAPISTYYTSVIGSNTGQNYSAYLLGDVTGNYVP